MKTKFFAVMILMIFALTTAFAVFADNDRNRDQDPEPILICKVTSEGQETVTVYTIREARDILHNFPGSYRGECVEDETEDGESSSAPVVTRSSATPRRLIDLLWGVLPAGTVNSMTVNEIDIEGDFVSYGDDVTTLLAAPSVLLNPVFVVDDPMNPGNFSYIISYTHLNQGPNYFVAYENGGTLAALIRVDRNGDHLIPVWTVALSPNQTKDPLYPGA